MKKSMLLTATAVVLIGVIFCGCNDYSHNEGSIKNVCESTFESVQNTDFSSVANTVNVTESSTTQQTSTVPSKPYEDTESLTQESEPSEYSEETKTQATQAFCDSTEPLYVSSYVYSDIELEVFELINQERAYVGVKPLKLSYVYADCAHVRAMEADTYWSHTRPDGSDFSTVLNEYNLQNSYLLVGENLASGFNSAEQTMNGLMNSPGHRANILREEYTEVSVSAVPMSGYPGYYVLSQIFIAEK
ncbi:MAG: hypothetical protein IJO20_04915 [Ruminococcus sp.]|nr:hypothetical protein [Ruminococcus sp.]